MKLYGIWCKDEKGGKGDWFREMPFTGYGGGEAILAYTSKRAAQERAAENYGFDTYNEAYKNDWVEVKPL